MPLKGFVASAAVHGLFVNRELDLGGSGGFGTGASNRSGLIGLNTAVIGLCGDFGGTGGERMRGKAASLGPEIMEREGREPELLTQVVARDEGMDAMDGERIELVQWVVRRPP